MTGKYTWRAYDDDFVTRVARDLKKGDDVQDVCARHQVSYTTCLKWAKQLEIVVKRAPRRSRHNWEAIKKSLG